MTVSDFAGRPIHWISDRAPEASVAVSSRVRLARNVAHIPFPAKAPPELRCDVQRRVFDAARQIKRMRSPWTADMGELTELERAVLLERRLITPELSRRGQGSGVAVAADEVSAVLVNEEDHLRLQALLPGFQLRTVWRRVDDLDAEIGQAFSLSFRPDLGFLTSCPTNLGTGMRASVMLHLPGLMLADQVDGLTQATRALGLAVRGIFGEGSEAVGSYFQVSNQSTLGESEEELITRIERAVRRTIWAEKNVRINLLHDNRIRVYDFVGRSYGILRYATRLSSTEAIQHLSAVRLGIDLGLFPSLNMRAIDETVVRIQPGHLQLLCGKKLDTDARDHARSEMVRAVLFPPSAGKR